MKTGMSLSELARNTAWNVQYETPDEAAAIIERAFRYVIQNGYIQTGNLEDFFGRKGDGKPYCPACGIGLHVSLSEHVKNCLFWQIEGRKLEDYVETSGEIVQVPRPR
jgi:hypothetical protein